MSFNERRCESCGGKIDTVFDSHWLCDWSGRNLEPRDVICEPCTAALLQTGHLVGPLKHVVIPENLMTCPNCCQGLKTALYKPNANRYFGRQRVTGPHFMFIRVELTEWYTQESAGAGLHAGCEKCDRLYTPKDLREEGVLA